MTLTQAEIAHWFHIPQPRERPLLRLYTFPFAGGTGTAYHAWAKLLPPSIELCAVMLPGRLGRLEETPYNRMAPLVAELARLIARRDPTPFLLFGHSMGAVLAYEVSHRLWQQFGRLPLHLIASGHRAPQLPNRRAEIYRLPQAQFIEELRQFNGTPPQLLADQDLMDLLLPALRADFEMLGTLPYVERAPLPLPITAFGGREDGEASLAEIEAWSIHTGEQFNWEQFDGGHFFVHERRGEVVARVGAICIAATAALPLAQGVG